MQILIIAVAFLLLFIDWRQTLHIAREPQRYREAWNLVLPEHPSVAQVHTWFFAVTLIAGAALWLLPDWRTPIAAVGAVMEAACVVNNFRHGLGA